MENVHVKITLMRTSVLPVNPLTLDFQVAKVCPFFVQLESILLTKVILISECKCDPKGSASLECDANGDCTCKQGFIGSKCDECQADIIGEKCDACKPNFFNYPFCQGKFLTERQQTF